MSDMDLSLEETAEDVTFDPKKIEEYIKFAFPDATDISVQSSGLRYKVGNRAFSVAKQYCFGGLLWALAAGISFLGLLLTVIESYEGMAVCLGLMSVLALTGSAATIRVSLHWETLFKNPLAELLQARVGQQKVLPEILRLLWATAYAAPLLARRGTWNPFALGAKTNRIGPMVGDYLVQALVFVKQAPGGLDERGYSYQKLLEDAVNLAKTNLEGKFFRVWGRSVGIPKRIFLFCDVVCPLCFLAVLGSIGAK
jgi:hypothetical protein